MFKLVSNLLQNSHFLDVSVINERSSEDVELLCSCVFLCVLLDLQLCLDNVIFGSDCGANSFPAVSLSSISPSCRPSASAAPPPRSLFVCFSLWGFSALPSSVHPVVSSFVPGFLKLERHYQFSFSTRLLILFLCTKEL